MDFKSLTKTSKERWEENARHWDQYMGKDSNRFHRELIRPYTEKLLNIQDEDKVLDIACGNGNFSRRLAERGARVTAIDYSTNLIQCAKERNEAIHDNIDYRVMDATNKDQLLTLGIGQYDKAVSNMALMDISEIEPLFQAVHQLLKPNGSFVFSIMHPCFQTPGMKKIKKDSLNNHCGVFITQYNKSEYYEGDSIPNQPRPTVYFHRSLSTILNMSFKVGFVLDGMVEPVFKADQNALFEWVEIPAAMIIRLKKLYK
jgi:2-polyprenyl-3-methyl-5-hydroxy-6-metoxy-1,4-benzoquinol methylase